jgi:urease accessory protein
MIAELNIATKLRDGITYLGKTYCTPPFKLADVREDKRDKTLQLMLMSSSPGILDGDEYRVNIEVNEGCSLDLQTQSYQRIFNMKGSAIQHFDVLMQNEASFSYLPHPSVPHENSSFTTRNKIYLTDNCKLIWGEVLTCGRKLNGEVFLFTKYHSITEVFLNNKLIIKENLLIQPATINVHAMGQMEGYTHQASLICLGFDTAKEVIKTFLTTQSDIDFGITEVPKGGILVRILGQKAEQLHQCLKTIANMVNAKTELTHAV